MKGIPENKARVLFAGNNFWDRMISAILSFSDLMVYHGFGPFLPGFTNVKCNCLVTLEEELERDADNIAAFMVEHIQGGAGGK